MDELIKLVSDKAGITDAQAKQAVDAVLDFLKQNLPEPLAGQIDGVLKGDLGGLLGGLGGLFGK